MTARTAAIVLLAGCLGACNKPALAVAFLDAVPSDSCMQNEPAIVSTTASVWVGVRSTDGVEQQACQVMPPLQAWRDMEEALAAKGPLLYDFPYDEPLDVIAIGLPTGCPETTPTGPMTFCAQTIPAVVLSTDDDALNVYLERDCTPNRVAQACLGIP